MRSRNPFRMKSADYRAAHSFNAERAQDADGTHGKLPRAKFVKLDDGTFGVKFANKKGRIAPGASVFASSLHRSSVVIVGEIVGGEPDGTMTARIDKGGTDRIRSAEIAAAKSAREAEREVDRAAEKADTEAACAKIAASGIATFAKIDGKWVLRVPLDACEGSTVPVRRRDGGAGDEIVGRIIRVETDVKYAEVGRPPMLPIRGETFAVKDRLRGLGCRWDGCRWNATDERMLDDANAVVQDHAESERQRREAETKAELERKVAAGIIEFAIVQRRHGGGR